ncbi:hypothetical protein AYK24_00690 [Thermoplasmatales archaeon SG8-52-4]|nr:MAG: hypothetical protein AYK24_00690 [Thermoplasmatales archaeon SG8-52-4]
MKKYLILHLVIVMFIGIFLSGCSESQSIEEQRFVGTWIMEEMETTITFYSNGEIKGVFGDKYEIKDGKFVILTRFAGGYNQEFYSYSFYNNDTRLTLTNIETEVIHNLIKK